MNIGYERDYVLTFQAQGIPFLVGEIFVAGYRKLNPVYTLLNGKYSQYFPLEDYQLAGEAGLALYGDEKAFADYQHSLVTQRELCDQLAKEMRLQPMTKASLQTLFAAWDEFNRLYYFMDIEHTEAAAAKVDDPVTKKHLQLLAKMKDPAREVLNVNILLEDSFLNTHILTELERRFTVSLADLRDYSIQDLYNLFDGAKVEESVLRARREAAVIQADITDIRMIWGKEAASLITEFARREIVTVNELRGTSANIGETIRGTVALIHTDYTNYAKMQAEMAAMQPGTILIAQTTSPELMVAIKKAAAIVTDIGGLMSHSAIVSRELAIPCLVGTKYATSTFRDGEMVEVDTKKGTIRRLN